MSVYKPGTVVCANYTDFSGNPLQGIFVVLYDEELDSSHSMRNNIVVCKVTTSYSMIRNYCVPLNDGHNEFFYKDCMALCSKLHTFSKDQVYSVLGNLNSYTLRQVYKVYRRYETELERQMEDYI